MSPALLAPVLLASLFGPAALCALLALLARRGRWPPASATRAASWLTRLATLAAFGFALAAALLLAHDRPGIQLRHDLLGLDGLAALVLLAVTGTGLLATLTPLPRVRTDERREPPPESPGYFGWLLLLTGALAGTVLTTDLRLYGGFWLLALPPAFALLVRHSGVGREVAAARFLSAGLLSTAALAAAAAWLHAHLQGGDQPATFDLATLATRAAVQGPAAQLLLSASGRWAFLGLLLAAALRFGLFPLHAWLGEVHAEAPPSVAMLVGGAFTLTGGHALLALALRLAPQAAFEASGVLAIAGAVQLVWGALLALSQRDARRLVGGVSLAHGGFVLFGAASLTAPGLDGAAFTLVSRTLLVAVLVAVVGALHERARHRLLDGFGGLLTRMPRLALIAGAALLAAGATPGLAGFPGALLALLAGFANHGWLSALGLGATIVLATAGVWAFQRVFLGPLNERYRPLADLSTAETLRLGLPAALLVLGGLVPGPLLALARSSLHALASVLAER